MTERPPSGITASILSLGGDPTQVTAALIEPVTGPTETIFRLVGWWTVPVPPGQDPAHVHQLYAQACQNLGAQLGRPLWDEARQRPVTEDPEPGLGLQVGHVVAAAQPLPPLRAWVAGLTGHESLAALQAALATAPCQPVGLYRPSPGRDPSRLAQELQGLAPDVAIVAGGYDLPETAAQEPILGLCDLIAQALSELPPPQRPALYFAGNRWAAAEALELWEGLPGGVVAEAVENVAPGPGVQRWAPLTVALSRAYWRRCQALPSLGTLAAWTTPPAQLRSFAWSFVQSVRLWREVQGLQDLHAIYCRAGQRLHVWDEDEPQGVRIHYPRPGAEAPPGWPPPLLLSGCQPTDLPWGSRVRWVDPEGLAPLAGNVGQIDPEIARQVLALDVFAPAAPPGAIPPRRRKKGSISSWGHRGSRPIHDRRAADHGSAGREIASNLNHTPAKKSRLTARSWCGMF